MSSLQFFDNPPEPQDLAAEVRSGLSGDNKSIPPKFFYDETGSKLFTEITRQPEYYLTRTELELLNRHAGDISALIGPGSLLIEFGSGSSEKVRILLEGLRPSAYAPLDISRDYLAQSAGDIAESYPWLEVRAACLDYTREIELPFAIDARPVGFFPGSSIGNFDRDGAAQFLKQVKRLLGDEGSLLIGVDMKKDDAVLNSAYNDAAGVTEAFNLNVLTHLNETLATDFVTGNFTHEARYNASAGCIQMFLRSAVAQQVSLDGQLIRFAADERIHTENSFKYSPDEFLAMARDAGYANAHRWSDDNEWFSIFLLS